MTFIEKEFLKETSLDVSNWQTQLTSKKGLTQVFSRMVELTLLKHDKRQAALSNEFEQVQKEFSKLRVYLKQQTGDEDIEWLLRGLEQTDGRF